MSQGEAEELVDKLRGLPAPTPPAGLESALLAAIPTPKDLRQKSGRSRRRAAGWFVAASVALGLMAWGARDARPPDAVTRSTSAASVLPSPSQEPSQETDPCCVLPPRFAELSS